MNRIEFYMPENFGAQKYKFNNNLRKIKNSKILSSLKRFTIFKNEQPKILRFYTFEKFGSK